ncbi:MAG: disulfide bond formation protein B [Rhizobiaceae bacterium]|nr:disulfide bond formation protein B [Rhizobiaceae bacterium]
MNLTNRAGAENASDFAKAASEADLLWSKLFVAWLVALAATLGALFIGEVMGQTPCLLCWYQRAFMFPLTIVLAVGAFRSDSGTWRYGLPLAVIGGGIALYHSLLYAGVIAEALEPCGQGPSCTDAAMTIFGILPLPFISFAAFAAVTILLLLTTRTTKP